MYAFGKNSEDLPCWQFQTLPLPQRCGRKYLQKREDTVYKVTPLRIEPPDNYGLSEVMGPGVAGGKTSVSVEIFSIIYLKNVKKLLILGIDE
ncbi:MAG TPA: hypothetical protein DCP92_00735 [Nitrospiraceae bacterium]|jgi:hypothetical protein|nr:hypothetical protein [Nitrospiraceae bacterium]